MKKLCMLLVLCLAGLMMSSCTPTETWRQHNQRYCDITRMNNRMLVEDWDYIWLYDRSSMLTNWHMHIGF